MTDELADHLREHTRTRRIVVTDMVRIERGQQLARCCSCGRCGVYLRSGEPRCRYCGAKGLS